MRATRSTTARAGGRGVFGGVRNRCRHCGRELDRVTVDLFGKPTEVPCWGSCGCEESKWDGMGVPPSEREWARAGIPARYLKAKADVAGAVASVESGRSLYIHGPYGTGKTSYACALAKSLVNRGSTVRFENSRHLMAEVQGLFDGRRTDALDRAYGCRVLVLDDIGKEQVTPYAVSLLYELVDSRYMAGKPIVATSNFSRGELASRLCEADAATAESIVSRLSENCDTLFMDGSDRRLA